MTGQTPTNAETVASFLNVFSRPLARAIVDAMQERQLVVSIDNAIPKASIKVFAANADDGKYEAMEKQYKDALFKAETLVNQLASANGRELSAQAQIGRLESKIEMLQVQLADAKPKMAPARPHIPTADEQPDLPAPVIRAKPAAIREAAERNGRATVEPAEQEVNTPHNGGTWHRRGNAKADALDEAIDREDALPEESADEVGDTCQTCLWFSGRICQRKGSPRADKHVVPETKACEKYVHAKVTKDGDGLPLKPKRTCETCEHRVNELCTSAGSPKQWRHVGAADGCDKYDRGAPTLPTFPVKRPRAEGDIRLGKRPRTICPGCGDNVAAKRVDGKLVPYSHARDGEPCGVADGAREAPDGS